MRTCTHAIAGRAPRWRRRSPAAGELASREELLAAAASILGLIVVPPEFPYIKLHPDERTARFRRFRDSLEDRPGFKWVEDMYARHRGASAEVAAYERA